MLRWLRSPIWRHPPVCWIHPTLGSSFSKEDGDMLALTRYTYVHFACPDEARQLISPTWQEEVSGN